MNSGCLRRDFGCLRRGAGRRLLGRIESRRFTYDLDGRVTKSCAKVSVQLNGGLGIVCGGRLDYTSRRPSRSGAKDGNGNQTDYFYDDV